MPISNLGDLSDAIRQVAAERRGETIERGTKIHQAIDEISGILHDLVHGSAEDIVDQELVIIATEAVRKAVA